MRRRLILWTWLGIVAVPLAIVLLWDWNWFRPLVASNATQMLGRPVTLARFDVHLGRAPQVVLDGVVIGNPQGYAPDSKMATIGRLVVGIDPHALLQHRVELTQIDIERPNVELARGPAGKPNWLLGKPTSDEHAPGSAQPWRVDVGELLIHDGSIHFVDPTLKSDFQLALHTQTTGARQEPSIVATIDGLYSGQAIQGRFTGGSILSLRDPRRPYPVDLELSHGSTRVALKGSVRDPLKLAGADLLLQFDGDDLAALYPLTGVPLAPSPPYSIKGRLDFAPPHIRFRDFSGTVGDSDLEGNVDIDLGRARRLVTGDMHSRRVVMADLAGFIGAAPGRSASPREAPEQKAQHAQQESSGKLLPDTPINLSELRSADLAMHYRAEHIEDESVPIDRLDARIRVDNGQLVLEPLDFDIGQGSIALNLQLSGRQDPAPVRADIDFRQVDLSRIMQSVGTFHGTGLIGGKANIDTQGDSLAQMLANGNGNVALIMSGGDLSAVLVDLAGLDFGKSLISALGIPDRTQVRCMVSDFGLERGQLNTRLMVLDTGEANVIGEGKIALATETIDYRLTTEPKHFSLGRLRAPILIRGPLKKPSIMPDPKALATRAGLAALLGTVLTPLGALIPTIQFGTGKDQDCAQLIASAEASEKQPAPAAPAPK
jgi:AsmA family protein